MTKKETLKPEALLNMLEDLEEAKRKAEESEEKYRTLFTNMRNGYAYCKIILDKNKKPVDWIYLEVNNDFEKLTGLKNVVGKRVTKAIPGIKKAHPELFDIYGKVALTGKHIQFNIEFKPIEFKPLGIWLSISVYSPKKGYFVAVFENITERKKAEEVLTKTNAMLSEAEKMAHIGSWEWNILKDEFIMSDEWMRITGVIKPNLSMDELMSIAHPDDAKTISKNFKEALDGIKPYDITHRIIRQDNKKVRTVYAKANVIRDKKGKPIRMVGTAQDITERKKTEEALKESEEKYRKFITTIIHGIQEIDINGIITYGNKAYLNMTGYKSDEIVGKYVWDLIAGNSQKKQLKSYLKYLVKNQPKPSPYFQKNITKDGNVIDVNVGWNYKRNDKGKVVGFISLMTDITKQKKAEEKVKETLNLLNNVINSSKDLIFVKDRKLRTILCNESYSGAMGKKPEEMYGKTDIENGWNPELVKGNPKKGIKGFESDDKKALKGEIVHNPYDPANVKGKIRIFDTIKLPLRDKAGKIIGVLGIARDVTEQKKAEEGLKDIFNFSPDMIAVCTTEGKFLKVNPSWEKVLGYTQKELLKLGWAKFVHPDDVERTNKEVEKQLKGSTIVNFVNRYKCKDGSYKTFEWQATFVKHGIVYATARDITQRKKAEEALKESEERFRTSVENMLDCFGIYSAVRNKNGKITDFKVDYVNEEACKSNKITRREQIGKMLCKLLPSHKTTGLFDEYCKVVRTGKPLVKESLIYEDIYKKQNLIRAFDIRAVKLGDGFAASWRDITEQKKAEEKFLKQKEKYEKEIRTLKKKLKK